LLPRPKQQRTVGYSTSSIEFILIVVFLMSGIFVLARECFVVFRSGKSQGNQLLWASVRVVFILSAAAAWFVEHESRIKGKQDLATVRARLEDLTLPHLNPSFTFSSAPFGGKGDDTVLTLFIKISNTGAPSSTDDFRVAVMTHGTSLEARELSREEAQPMTINGLAVPLDLNEWIPAVSKQSIATGGRMSGWEQFLISGVPANSFKHKGDGSVFLRFYDVNNALYQISRDADGEETNQPVSPRLLQPGLSQR
jgi:hypothetical protein